MSSAVSPAHPGQSVDETVFTVPSVPTRAKQGIPPGVGTPVRGGVTYREAHLALEMIADSKSMVSFEIVEINPVIDLHNTTATLGVELALSGLGKKIL